jgi:transcriptional regulator with XRE-family HTH domain
MSSKKPDPKDIEVGHRVRAIRLEKGMSQEKLGDALDLTFQQVQKYEKGTNRIGAGRLQHIAEILGVPVADLFSSTVGQTVRSDSLFELADTVGALRLLRAYSQISSPKLKQSLMSLAEQIAQQSEAPARNR